MKVTRHNGVEPGEPNPGEVIVGSAVGDPVHIGCDSYGYFLISPEAARAIAGSLLCAADVSEGNEPAHIYTVDCRE